MNFLKVFQNRDILIPLLQRDYVQGGKEEVINPFLDALLEKECDLNYIYGYEEDSCFVPVDGQQRLITLWILHLYLFARKQKSKDYSVKLKFYSREYAQDFCAELQKHLEELLKSDGIASKSLDKEIEDQAWFIRSWKNNVTVRNMLQTLKYLHQKVKSENLDDRWRWVCEQSHITFAFLSMDERNGLDDDIYIKMNGRGRPLSAFENLKSWMDERVSTLPFGKEWKQKMDNDWTDVFWKNRNQAQEHPEEIDDEQLHCFYNFLILYHVRSSELADTIEEIKENNPNQYIELLLFFKVNNENAKIEELVDTILKRLQEGIAFPLIWIERLKLMPSSFFEKAFQWLNSLLEETLYQKEKKTRYQALNDLNLYIGINPLEKSENTGENKESKKTYQLAMCKSSYNRTLPLLYAVLSYRNGCTSFFDWMRTLRNLILNTNITKESLPKVMTDIENFSDEAQKQNIYDVLEEYDTEKDLKSFDKRQVKEEILKAKLIPSPDSKYYSDIVRLENGRLFRGRIGCLLNFLPAEIKEGFDSWTLDNVNTYVSVLLNIFDGSEGGINANYDNKKYLLRRALISFPPYKFGIRDSNRVWCFCSNLEEWRRYVCIEDVKDNNSLRLLIREVLAPAYKMKENLLNVLEQYVETLSRNYENDIINVKEKSYKFHFIHHPGVWDYMKTKRCSWSTNDFDITLKAQTGNRSHRMELRTYCLYLDYKHNSIMRENRKGWKIDKWPEEKSCFFFEREVNYNGEKRKIAIDVYFYNEKRERPNENCYSFDIFLRINEEDKKKATEGNKKFFSQFPNVIELCEIRENDCRYHAKRTYSRDEVLNVLREVLMDIASETKVTDVE